MLLAEVVRDEGTNIIPQSQISAAGVALTQLFPLPNRSHLTTIAITGQYRQIHRLISVKKMFALIIT